MIIFSLFRRSLSRLSAQCVLYDDTPAFFAISEYFIGRLALFDACTRCIADVVARKSNAKAILYLNALIMWEQRHHASLNALFHSIQAARADTWRCR